MQMIKKESGITMIVLVITIIILGIISTILISYSVIGTNESKDKKLLANLEAVQQAVFQRYEQYKITEDETLILGKNATKPSYDIDWAENNKYWSTSIRVEQYLYITEEEQKELGIENTNGAIYVVNYYTGEVYDQTNQKTSTGKVLYIK